MKCIHPTDYYLDDRNSSFVISVENLATAVGIRSLSLYQLNWWRIFSHHRAGRWIRAFSRCPVSVPKQLGKLRRIQWCVGAMNGDTLRLYVTTSHEIADGLGQLAVCQPNGPGVASRGERGSRKCMYTLRSWIESTVGNGAAKEGVY